MVIRIGRGFMLDPQKTFEREELLRRHRELQAEIAQHERNMRGGEARLSLEAVKP
jgi:hypothetical protein